MRSVNVIAIHGTRADDAKWPLENGILCSALKENLNGEFTVDWKHQKWTGNNSHSAREKGADELCRLIASLPLASNENLNILIGHSHGGNLALMALASNSETRKKISAVVCLSTPFIKARKHTSIMWDMLNDKPLMTWIVCLPAALVLAYSSNKIFRVHWLLTMILVIVWAGMTGALAFYTRIVAKEVQPAEVLRLYEYSRISAHVLSLRTRFDEALIAVRGAVHFAAFSNLLPVIILLTAGLLMVMPLVAATLGLPFFVGMDVNLNKVVGWMFPTGLALAIFYPFVVMPAQILSTLSRFLSMGENPGIGIFFRFGVTATPTKIRYFEDRVVTDFSKFSTFKFRWNHSFLHSRPETAIPIAAMIRSCQFDQKLPLTLLKTDSSLPNGFDFDWVELIEWIGVKHILDVPLKYFALAVLLASFIGIQAFDAIFGSELGSISILLVLVVLAMLIIPASRKPPFSLFRFSLLLAALLSLVFIWLSWHNGSIGFGRAISYFLANLVGVYSFLIILIGARNLMRPYDAGSDYLDSTSEWISRCIVRLLLRHPTIEFVVAEKVATELSKQKEFRLQSPETAADRVEVS